MSVTHKPEETFETRIESAQALLHSIARKIHRKLGPHVAYDDVLAYGQVGLAQSSKSFDPGRGASFTTFAYLRIRGAIYEGLSEMRAGERLRNPALVASRAAAEVLSGEGDEPGSEPVGNAQWLVRKTEALAMVHLLGQSGDNEFQLADKVQPGPDSQAEMAEAISAVRLAIERLPALEKDAIRKIYYDGWSLTQFAERHGKSKSWATRLHQKIIDSLGEAMSEHRE